MLLRRAMVTRQLARPRSSRALFMSSSRSDADVPGPRNRTRSHVRGTRCGEMVVEHGVVNLHSFNVMLKSCKDSGEMREVIDVVMPKANVKPNVVTYTMLISTLRMEGDV